MNQNRSVLTGTFLLCFGMLAFEILSTRLLSIVVGPYLVIFVIALAMLGMSFAASLLSIRTRWTTWLSAPGAIPALTVLLAFSYVASLFALNLTGDYFNDHVRSAIEDGGIESFVDFVLRTLPLKVSLAGFILAAPYVVFGLVIVLIFKRAKGAALHRIYFADLLGAAAGAAVCIVVMEFGGYAATCLLIVISTILAFVAFGSGPSRIPLAAAGVTLTLVLFLTPTTGDLFEPSPNPDSLAGQWDNTGHAVETWHAWNSHSRVARMAVTSGSTGEARDIYAHGDGVAWARVPDLEEPMARIPDQARIAMALAPRKVLVLFAGVGDDMVAIDGLCRAQCEVTGVEINRTMTDHAVAASPGLRAFLGRENIDLVNAEAREFLERDRNRYDAILLSWSGAGYSYYVGSTGSLAQYVYTREGYETLLDHLNPGGVLIIADGSKARSLVTFRELFDAGQRGSLASSVVAIKRATSPTGIRDSSQLDVFDRVFMVVKPGGFSEEEVGAYEAIAAEGEHRMVYRPGGASEDYALYEALISTRDLESFVASFESERGLSIRSATDDQPFFLNLTPAHFYFSLASLFGPADDRIPPEFVLARTLFKLFLVLGLLAVLIVFAPLRAAEGPPKTSTTANHLVFFLSVGLGFMLIEVGLIQRFGLVLGNPSLAIAVILAAIIFSAGVGSLCSERLFSRGPMTFRRIVLLVLAYSGMLLFSMGAVADWLLSMPVLLKSTVTCLMLLPLGFLLGQLFPQGLKRAAAYDDRLVPWAWALNGSASMIAVGAAVFLAYPLGYQAIILLGMASYALILLLPVYRS